MADETGMMGSDVLRHFERSREAIDRPQQIRAWAISLICWDGALPFIVIAIPQLMALVFRARQGLLEITFVVVPTVAFVLRYVHGRNRFQSRLMHWWQLGLFFVAIFVLFAFDALVVLSAIVQGPVPGGFLTVCVIIYVVYLSIVAVALFPFRANPQANYGA